MPRLCAYLDDEEEFLNDKRLQIIDFLINKKASMTKCNKGWLPFHYG